MNILLIINNIIKNALIKGGVKKIYKNYLQIAANHNEKFGHYKINGLIQISKYTKLKIKEIYILISTDLKLNIISKKILLSANTIVNLTLNSRWLIKLINKINIPKEKISNDIDKKIILDYSSPNLAKTLHIGHLRSTILGDAMANIYNYLGYKVIRVNHVGDWGTPIGMIIAYIMYKNIFLKTDFFLKEINDFYIQAQRLYQIDKLFINLTRFCLLSLQRRYKKTITLWRKIRDLSLKENQSLYNYYKINLSSNDVCGESFYVDYLSNIVEDLQSKGLAKKSKGAIITNLSSTSIKNIIIQKSDGSYLYATTDLAALKYRCDKFSPYKIIYYVDIRQRQYLYHIWAIAKKAGYVPAKTLLEHHYFGMILGEDGKPLKSREGKYITLEELLTEAINRTENIVLNRYKEKNILYSQKKNPIKDIIYKLAIGSIKYTDLSRNRESNYVFEWDKTLTWEGNTALYIQYAYCRIRSILNKVNIDKFNHIQIKNLSQEELKLILYILRFEEILETVIINGYPNILCNYLYKLTKQFSFFYDKINIINEKNTYYLKQRIKILNFLLIIIKRGMNLLGIPLSNKI